MLSLAVVFRTIGRRTEERRKGPAQGNEEGNAQECEAQEGEEEKESSSSDENGEDAGVEASAGDPHLMTKKELQRTFKEHTVDAQAVVTAVADAKHVCEIGLNLTYFCTHRQVRVAPQAVLFQHVTRITNHAAFLDKSRQIRVVTGNRGVLQVYRKGHSNKRERERQGERGGRGVHRQHGLKHSLPLQLLEHVTYSIVFLRCGAFPMRPS